MHDGYDYEPRDYGYEPGERPGRPDFSDTQPGEPVFDYSIWPPEPEAARDENLRRLGRLTWRAALLSAVGAAAFAVLFVRSAPAHTTATSQNVERPASTLTPPTATPTATPTPSPRHPRHKARGRGADDAALAPTPGGAATSSPTLAPPATPPAPSPSPSPAQSTSSGSHSGG
jgi:hypothetical protein